MTIEAEAILQRITSDEAAIAADWVRTAAEDKGESGRRASESEALELLRGVRDGLRAGGEPARLAAPAWAALREALEALSASRAAQGQPAGETSSFVLAFKRPLFAALQKAHGGDASLLLSALWALSLLADQMAQLTVTTYQRTREDIIRRQQQELLELSTPVIKLWDGVLAVPMIGTLDSSRTQLVMEALLERIAAGGARLAIIDITGVPTVDTLVAQHLLKTVSAIRLMGADCIISGIRPQIAQTMVHLGIELQGISTRSSLADALALAFARGGLRVTSAR